MSAAPRAGEDGRAGQAPGFGAGAQGFHLLLGTSDDHEPWFRGPDGGVGHGLDQLLQALVALQGAGVQDDRATVGRPLRPEQRCHFGVGARFKRDIEHDFDGDRRRPGRHRRPDRREVGYDHVRTADNAPLGPGRQHGNGVPVAQPVVPGYDGELVAHVVHVRHPDGPGQQPQYPGLLVGMQDLVTAPVHDDGPAGFGKHGQVERDFPPRQPDGHGLYAGHTGPQVLQPQYRHVFAYRVSDEVNLMTKLSQGAAAIKYAYRRSPGRVHRVRGDHQDAHSSHLRCRQGLRPTAFCAHEHHTSGVIRTAATAQGQVRRETD